MGRNSQHDYDYIIIGSGFGGSVAALRLAEKGYRVLVLEKGKWFSEKDYPKRNWNLKRWLWMPLLRFFGFFKISFFRHVTILSGVGVGGGSLVYANTLYVPPEPFFTDPQWGGITDWAAALAQPTPPGHFSAARWGLVQEVVPADQVHDTTLDLARRAIELGYDDQDLPVNWRVFFYLPFEHSEELADQHRAVRAGFLVHDIEQVLRSVMGEVADRRTGEVHDVVARHDRRLGKREGLGKVGDDGQHLEIRKFTANFAGACYQVILRDIDRHVDGEVVQVLEQHAGLAAGPGAVLDEAGLRSHKVGNLLDVVVHDPEFGFGRVVLGQARDLVEELRAALVVEELGRDRARPALQAGDNGVEQILGSGLRVVKSNVLLFRHCCVPRV